MFTNKAEYRCIIESITPWQRVSGTPIRVGQPGGIDWDNPEASAESQFWLDFRPFREVKWVFWGTESEMVRNNRVLTTRPTMTRYGDLQVSETDWVHPPIDGCWDNQYFDIKWHNSWKEYKIGDYIKLWLTEFQRDHCIFFVAVQTKNVNRPVKNRFGVITGWAFDHQLCRYLFCKLIRNAV